MFVEAAHLVEEQVGLGGGEERIALVGGVGQAPAATRAGQRPPAGQHHPQRRDLPVQCLQDLEGRLELLETTAGRPELLQLLAGVEDQHDTAAEGLEEPGEGAQGPGEAGVVDRGRLGPGVDLLQQLVGRAEQADGLGVLGLRFQLGGQLDQELGGPPAGEVGVQVVEVDAAGERVAGGRQLAGEVADEHGLADPADAEVVQRPGATLLRLVEQALEGGELLGPGKEALEPPPVEPAAVHQLDPPGVGEHADLELPEQQGTERPGRVQPGERLPGVADRQQLADAPVEGGGGSLRQAGRRDGRHAGGTFLAVAWQGRGGELRPPGQRRRQRHRPPGLAQGRPDPAGQPLQPQDVAAPLQLLDHRLPGGLGHPEGERPRSLLHLVGQGQRLLDDVQPQLLGDHRHEPGQGPDAVLAVLEDHGRHEQASVGDRRVLLGESRATVAEPGRGAGQRRRPGDRVADPPGEANGHLDEGGRALGVVDRRGDPQDGAGQRGRWGATPGGGQCLVGELVEEVGRAGRGEPLGQRGDDRRVQPSVRRPGQPAAGRHQLRDHARLAGADERCDQLAEGCHEGAPVLDPAGGLHALPGEPGLPLGGDDVDEGQRPRRGGRGLEPSDQVGRQGLDRPLGQPARGVAQRPRGGDRVALGDRARHGRPVHLAGRRDRALRWPAADPVEQQRAHPLVRDAPDLVGDRLALSGGQVRQQLDRHLQAEPGCPRAALGLAPDAPAGGLGAVQEVGQGQGTLGEAAGTGDPVGPDRGDGQPGDRFVAQHAELLLAFMLPLPLESLGEVADRRRGHGWSSSSWRNASRRARSSASLTNGDTPSRAMPRNR